MVTDDHDEDFSGTSNPRLYLCHTSTSPKKLIAAIAGEHKPVAYMFLCQDFILSQKWEQILGKDFYKISLTDRLSYTSEILKVYFIKFISDLGKKWHSSEWWASHTVSKNTNISFLFLYICYLHVVRAFLKDHVETLCIVCESPALLESLAKLTNRTVKIVGRQSYPEKKILQILKRVAYVYRFIRLFLLGKIFGCRLAPPVNQQKNVLIHTFLENSCLQKGNIFKDRYFPGLAPWLEQRGYNVFILPFQSFFINLSYRAVWKWLRGSNQQFVNSFAYLHLSDVLCALVLAWRSGHIPRGRFLFDGMDVTKLIYEDNEKFMFSSLSAIIYLYLPKRLAEFGWIFHQTIQEYEGMVPERMLVEGFRTYFPGIYCVGCVHASPSPMFLSWCTTSEEIVFSPFPDRIVCNGQIYANILIQNGVPPDMVVSGPALRYAYLHASSDGLKVTRRHPIHDILVPLPLMVSDGSELLFKVLHAFLNTLDYRILIKPHPMSPEIKKLLPQYGIANLPEHFQCIMGEISDWLPRVSAAIVMSSSSAHEILAAGVPMIQVGREAAINLNSLGFFDGFNDLCYSSDEILSRMQYIVNMSCEDKENYWKRSKTIMDISFTRISDEAMEAFLLPPHL